MTHWGCPLLLTLALAGGCGDAPPPGGPGGSPTLAFTVSGLVVAGSEVALPCDLSELIEGLGAPSRTLPLAAGTTLVWDEHGLYAMAKPETTKVHTLGVAFRRADYPFWPRRLFAGPVRVGEHEVDAGTSPSRLDAAGLVADPTMRFYRERILGRLRLALEMDADAQQVVSIEAESAADKR